MRREKVKTVYWLRIITEIIFLLVFGLLLVRGRYQLWFFLFAAGLLASLILGRLFCGWICPMNTLFRPLNSNYNKLKINRLKTPGILQKRLFRYIFLAIFLVVMLITRRMGLNVPVLGFMLGIAILVTLIFEETLWHNVICPFGTLLNLSTRPAIFRMKIDEQSCISCGKCLKVCPTVSIKKSENSKFHIDHSDCLVCFSCRDVCPSDSIRYAPH